MDSLVNQTLQDIEIICFNDTSTDRSLSILNEYAAKDSRIIIIDSKINIKQGGGRNAGIRRSTAPYIMFVDPDDWVAPNFVERYYQTAIETDSDLVNGDYIVFADNKKQPASPLGKNITYDLRTFRIKILETSPPFWSNIYRKCLFLDYNLFFAENYQLGEDSIIAAATFFAAKKITKIDDELYYYRIHSSSSSHEINLSRYMQRFPTAVLTYNNLKKLDSNNEYEKVINDYFIKLYYTQTIFSTLDINKNRPYSYIRYANNTITNYISKDKLNKYLSNQTFGRRLICRVSMFSPRLSSIIYRLIVWKQNMINKYVALTQQIN